MMDACIRAVAKRLGLLKLNRPTFACEWTFVSRPMAGIAQPAVQDFCKVEVGGSSPSPSSKDEDVCEDKSGVCIK
jgi:hypothetical protein